eukprot:9000134-Alexandrium_andersonii.AAC.1
MVSGCPSGLSHPWHNPAVCLAGAGLCVFNLAPAMPRLTSCPARLCVRLAPTASSAEHSSS